MGILELLTVVFVVLKLTEVITWEWWVVFTPLGISVVIYTAMLAMFMWAAWVGRKS